MDCGDEYGRRFIHSAYRSLSHSRLQNILPMAQTQNLLTRQIFTMRGPSIVMYSYNKTNEKHQFLKFIFGIELYMFRTVSLSIIKSLALYTQQYIQVMATAC